MPHPIDRKDKELKSLQKGFGQANTVQEILGRITKLGAHKDDTTTRTSVGQSISRSPTSGVPFAERRLPPPNPLSGPRSILPSRPLIIRPRSFTPDPASRRFIRSSIV